MTTKPNLLALMVDAGDPTGPADRDVFTKAAWDERPWELPEQDFLAKYATASEGTPIAFTLLWERWTGEPLSGNAAACREVGLDVAIRSAPKNTSWSSWVRMWNRKQGEALRSALLRRALLANVQVPMRARPMWALTAAELFERAGLGTPLPEEERNHAEEVLLSAESGAPVPLPVLAWAAKVKA